MKISLLNKEKKTDLIYSVSLFGLLLLMAFPAFSFPPLGDTWEMLHFFHHLDELPGSVKWLHVLNYDPYAHTGYRPLAYLPFYLLHLFFAPHFIAFNIFNFAVYFLSMLVLYRFSLYFLRERVISAVFMLALAFLFTRFDILLWVNHTYIPAAFSLLLFGFMNYIKYLRSARPVFLFSASLCFLLGTLCYEPFILWPLGAVILYHSKSLRVPENPEGIKSFKASALALGAVYAFYLLFLLFAKSLGTYGKVPYDISGLFRLSSFISTPALVIFQLFYNSIFLNMIPFLAFPLSIWAEYVYMSGPVIGYIADGRHWVVFAAGGAGAALLLLLFIYMLRKKYFEELKIIGFFAFLTASASFITFFCRITFNKAFIYNLMASRYQFIADACAVLIVSYLIDRFLKPSAFQKKIIFGILAVVFVFNLYCIRRLISVYEYHSANLKKMLCSISSGIGAGRINRENRIYIDEDMPEYLPHLCWSIPLGSTLVARGNYQWFFSAKEMPYFADGLDDATWVIDKRSFSFVHKSDPGALLQGDKINTIKGRWYVALGKDREYVSVGFIYMEQKKYSQAIKMFKKALELEPGNNKASSALSECSKFQEATAILKED